MEGDDDHGCGRATPLRVVMAGQGSIQGFGGSALAPDCADRDPGAAQHHVPPRMNSEPRSRITPQGRPLPRAASVPPTGISHAPSAGSDQRRRSPAAPTAPTSRVQRCPAARRVTSGETAGEQTGTAFARPHGRPFRSGSRRPPHKPGAVPGASLTGPPERVQAIGSFFTAGRLSQRFPAATMQLMPVGVVLTTVQVPFCSEE